jgi:hypothetical protein
VRGLDRWMRRFQWLGHPPAPWVQLENYVGPGTEVVVRVDMAAYLPDKVTQRETEALLRDTNAIIGRAVRP